MFDLSKAIEALEKAASSGFSFAQTLKEQQSETAMLKDRYKLQIAVNISEQIILLAYRYYYLFSKQDKKHFKRLLKKFIKYN